MKVGEATSVRSLEMESESAKPLNPGSEVVDDECRCGSLQCGAAGFCCICCGVRWGRIPELLYLMLVAWVTLNMYSPLPPQNLPARNRDGGVVFASLTLFYFPLVLLLACVCKDGMYFAAYFKWGRFRCASLLLSLPFWLLMLLPVLLSMGEVWRLDSTLQAEFGSSSPSRPTNRPFRLLDWMFLSQQTWGPYGSRGGDFEKKTYTYLTSLEKPDFEFFCDTSAENVRSWSDSLDLDVYLPQKTEGVLAPIIFFVHGGSWVSGDKLSSWSFAYFLERGYAVVSSQYGYACYGYSAFDMVGQLTAALDYVRANATAWGFDQDRIFVMGESAGGHVALMLGYTINSTVCGDWSSCGIKMVFEHYGPTQPIAETANRILSGGGKTEEEWAKAYPLYYASSSVPPTITFHGTWDFIVQYSLSVDLHKKLATFGVKHLLIPVPTFGHVCEYFYYGLPAQMQRYALERALALDNL